MGLRLAFNIVRQLRGAGLEWGDVAQFAPVAVIGKVGAVGRDGVGRKSPIKAREESIKFVCHLASLALHR